MALNKLKFNSLNVTPTAGKTIGFNSSANGLEATISGGSMTFIKKLTASSSSTLSFVDGSSDVVLDTTYKEYLFLFHNIHPSNNAALFSVGFRDGGSDYDAPKTSSYFYSSHKEDDSQTVFAYEASYDQAQGTGFHSLANVGNENDENLSGYIQLFNPGSTTFVKHFMSRFYSEGATEQCADAFVAGYCNTTAAIDAVQFKFGAGTIDAGTITLYGIN
jgi:hypothetical protein